MSTQRRSTPAQSSRAQCEVRHHQISDAPRLREAAARCVRRVTIKNLADRAHARGREVLCHGREKFLGPARVAVNTVMRASKGPQKPAPDGALMIGRVAGAPT
jgi:hypothetical protein